MIKMKEERNDGKERESSIEKKAGGRGGRRQSTGRKISGYLRILLK